MTQLITDLNRQLSIARWMRISSGKRGACGIPTGGTVTSLNRCFLLPIILSIKSYHDKSPFGSFRRKPVTKYFSLSSFGAVIFYCKCYSANKNISMTVSRLSPADTSYTGNKFCTNRKHNIWILPYISIYHHKRYLNLPWGKSYTTLKSYPISVH